MGSLTDKTKSNGLLSICCRSKVNSFSPFVTQIKIQKQLQSHSDFKLFITVYNCLKIQIVYICLYMFIAVYSCLKSNLGRALVWGFPPRRLKLMEGFFPEKYAAGIYRSERVKTPAIERSIAGVKTRAGKPQLGKNSGC